MPTENRSSNTEMVSLPREHELKIRQTPLADLLSGLKTGEIRDCSDREFAVGDTVLLREIDDGREYTGTVARRTITHVLKHYGLPDHLCVLGYGQPAPQPHPEPIAWMVGTAFWWTKEEAERDAAETGQLVVAIGPIPSPQRKPAWFMTEGGVSAMHATAKAMSDQQGLDTSSYCVPLYTHPDPDEVERCEARLHEVASLCATVEQERDTLRAQLAERDALLREADEFMYIMTGHDSHARLAHRYGEKWWDTIDKLRGKVCTALSASAEPSAPIAWHVGGNGYNRICFEEPSDLPGRPCIQAIHHQRQLIELLKRYDLREEDAPPDERAHGIPGTSFQRLNALANQGE
jgi:Domain of unknown function (DUF3850)